MFSYHTIDIEQDFETLYKFRKDSYVVSFGDDSLSGSRESYMNKLKERLVSFPDGLVIVKNNNQPIGQITMQIKPYEGKIIGYVNLFYLIEEYRNKGFGDQLIQYADKIFKKHEVTEYHLRVTTTNERAIYFYKKQGFKMLKKEEKHSVPRYRMCKILL
ncbi:GNAT family N-acetyltransferase [Chengkuizengella axinellae]|uniref:GNAT family N-acetyltransferase n=1 Tax=Chengkuizengella axinellae TaxID=3064388 RepID=A0ABT9J027_9BACL|nr:GNAT family N-acetyltransferase [Chengkuizengella sp. 2205SS18-9]MDP5274932.1 GNAT family N-acetyltransferase [Chengkuizengella sp. 2205SS18-9]